MMTTGTFINHSPAPHVCEERGGALRWHMREQDLGNPKEQFLKEVKLELSAKGEAGVRSSAWGAGPMGRAYQQSRLHLGSPEGQVQITC